MSDVWSKGDKCLAPWFSDGKLYDGSITKIVRQSDGRVFARIKYDGYGSEEEDVDISKLKKSPIIHVGTKLQKESSLTSEDLSRSIFKPLDGNEEERRIREKFSRLDSEDHEFQRNKPPDVSTDSAPNGKKKKKCYGPIFDSQEPSTSRADLTSKISKRSPAGKQTTDPLIQAHAKRPSADKADKSTQEVLSRVKTSDNDLSTYNSGFDNEDLEKPKFGFPAVAAKVPYKLSEDGPVCAVPASINQYLREYQRDGIRFLYENYTQRTGAILGDDMGLGKTVQVIGFLSALLRKQGNREDVMRLKPRFIRVLSDTERGDDSSIEKPFLIIGPGSVLYNWLDELETWGYFTAKKYHGSDKLQTLAEVKKGKIEIVVTTYETFRDNVDDLNSIKWCGVIVDEVHRIKGLNSQTTAALRKIRTPCRFGLTGTALQNNITELWSIIDWARPGFLGDLKSFEAEFVKKIERGQKHDATKRELAEARKMKEKFASLRNKMMIRRTKKLIADQLPAKDDNIVFSKLTELQVDVYKAILNHPDLKLILSMGDPCQCGSRRPQVKCCHQKTPDGTPVRHLMFTYMTLLMKTANHVALLIPDKNTSPGQRKHAKEICDIAFAKHPQFVSQASEASFRTLSDPKYCGKMKIMKGLLSVFQKNHSKILLFSYSTKLLSIVEQYVISVGYEYRRIDGSVSSKKRMDIVREFNNDNNIFICLISTKAGGLGLNLTGANVVIVFDPNWNPSYDLQAQDRAYRIGQRRNVRVFRLVSAGTIEENIYLRQVYKQQLDTVAIEMGNAKRYFHGIQGDKHHKGELFGLKNMFRLQTGEHCLTMDILKRNEKLEAGLKPFDIVEYVPCSGETEESESGEVIEEAANQSSADDTDEFGSFLDLFLNEDLGQKHARLQRSVKKKVKPAGKTRISCSSDEEQQLSSDSEGWDTTRGDNCSDPAMTRQELPLQLPKAGKGKSPGKSKSVKFTEPKETTAESFASVTDVFDNCGVLHVHKNVKMVGSSRAEDHMSRCAIQDVFELNLNSQIPAVQCPPLSQPSDNEDSDSCTTPKKKRAKSKSHGPTYNQPGVRVIDNTRVLIGQTPKAIKREQLEMLAAFSNSGSPIDFAEQVVNMSVKERVEILNSFYESQLPELSPLFSLDEAEQTLKSPSGKQERGTKAKLPLVKKTPQKQTRKVNQKRGKLGLTYDSSEDSYDTPANVVSQTDDVRPSTSHHRSNPQDSEEMIIGAKPLPRRSPATRKSVKTRLRKSTGRRDSGRNAASLVEPFPGTGIIQGETGDSVNLDVTDTAYQTSYCLPVENLLDEMISNKTDEVSADDNKQGVHSRKVSISHVSSEDPRPSSDKFSLLDDIFLKEEKNSPRKRKPPPLTSKKRKKELCEEAGNTKTVIGSAFEEQPESSRDLFESLEVVPGDTLKTKALDVFSDASKWKRRERKRPSDRQPETMSERVDNLINKGKEKYESMFASGKLRKVSRGKSDKKFAETGEKTMAEPKSPDSIQSPSLFSGQGL